VGLLYAALGLKQAFTVERRAVMPRDPVAIVEAVFKALGGVHVDRSAPVSRPEDVKRRNEEWERERKLKRLAEDALSFIQVQEALGREPSMNEAAGGFAWAHDALSPDADAAWPMFCVAIQRTLAAARP